MAAQSSFWQTVTRFEANKIQPWLALRNALGVALPLGIGAAIHNAGGGLIMASGALNVSFSDGSDPYLHRARRMLASSLCCALAVLVGGLCGQHFALAVLAASACAFTAGMMVAVGPTVTDIGNITLVTVVVYSAQQWTPKRALISALLALAGGLLQMGFALALWRVRRYTPERRALASLYAELGRAVAAGAPATEAPPASEQSTQAQHALESLSGDHSVEAERYLALLSQAERIRLSLLALFRLRVRLGREPESANETAALDSAMPVTERLLAAVAGSLESGLPAQPHPECVAELFRCAESLRNSGRGAMARDARLQLDALAGQLRSAVDLAGHVSVEGLSKFDRREAREPWRLRLEGALAVLRANLHLESAAFRHAVRLGVCVALGEIAGRTLNPNRSYWVPMTIAIVLRPDFTSTFSRGLLRLGGTLAGLAIATALFHFLTPVLAIQVVFIGAFAYLLRCFGSANYGVFVTALTALVVLMFAVTGVSPAQVMLARGLNTLIGGAIAIAAYALWPTWERTQVAEATAGLFDAYRRYFRVVRDGYLYPERSFAAELDEARLSARLARSNLEASVTRLRSEPAGGSTRLAALDGILANSHRFIHAVMSMEAGLSRSRVVPARDAFRTFSDHVDTTLSQLAASLRAVPPDGESPDLREDHHALLQSGDPNQERYALVNIETDRIANSLNTLRENLSALRQ